MRKLRLRPKARSDLDRIWAFTSEYWGQAQATNYREKIQQDFCLIARNSRIGQRRDEILTGLQVFTAEMHMICYLVDDQHIDVLRILHRRMDLENRILRPRSNLTLKH